MKPLAVVAIVVAGLISDSARSDEGAKLFADTCSPCHTIGGGDQAGPDLVRVKTWPVADVRKAIVRMQDNVGPMPQEKIEELVEFLRKPDAQGRLAALSAPPPQMTPEQKAASPLAGRRLFFGEQPFANGGTACFACHAVGGEGGTLAIDLTNVYARRGEAAVLTTEQQPAFPLMKAAYGGHAVTPQEAWHLVAFLKDAGNAPPVRPRTAVVHGTAAGLAIAVLAGVAIVFRPRRRR